MNKIVRLVFLMVLFISCKKSHENNINEIKDDVKIVQDYVMKNPVIAHRGTTYWAPEETEAAFRWARNIGANYLELDLQMTKDSVLIALHDNDLRRTTNISSVFPDRSELPTINFTLKELQSLDAGSWFNLNNPDRSRKSFTNLKILTLKDVIMIAEGYQIKKVDGKPVREMFNGQWNGKYLYENDTNGNRPGIYAETKTEHFEKLLAKELKSLGWLVTDNPKWIKTSTDKVGVANTKARFILQSFYPESILEFEKHLPNIPKCLLLWKDDMKGEFQESYKDAINFAVENNVHFIGPSIAGEPNNYDELSGDWMTNLIHKSGLKIHSYTFDTNEQFEKYHNRVDGVFTNRADLALEFYNRKSKHTSEEILNLLGY